MTLLLSDEKEIKSKIDAFISDIGLTDDDMVDQIVLGIYKMLRDVKGPRELKLIDVTLNELRKSFQLFSRYRDFRKVCIFGSSRTKPSQIEYQMTEAFSAKATERGLMVITGAGPGIMEAGNKGAEVNMSFGLNIQLPFEQDANPFIEGDPKLVSFQYFFNRKLIFIKESDATVLFPGGYGTHDEGFEVLTLVQTGRCAPRPIVLMSDENNDYWNAWIDFVENQLLGQGHISEEDLSLYKLTYDIDEAVQYILDFYRVYHSIRYFSDKTVMRLTKPLSEASLATINDRFSMVLSNGTFEQFTADQVLEDNEVGYEMLSRLVFPFNRMNFGKLTELIHFINTEG